MGRGGGRGGRPQLTPEQMAARRDSIAGLRAEYVKKVLAKIAGHESEPAGEVFNNVVTVMKDMPAGDFVKEMDQNFGYALSANCTSCHVADQWDDDSRNNKKRARIMIEMVNVINTQQLTKMPPGRNGETPTITCVTCHRGRGNPGRALLP